MVNDDKTVSHLNVVMLNDPTFKNLMESGLYLWLYDNDNGEVNPNILWGAAKAVLQGKVIARTAALKKEKNKKILNLQEKLKKNKLKKIWNRHR